MRSRYCAYAVSELAYLLATWHVSTTPGDLSLSLVKWTGLEVLHAAEAGEAGVVEFVARYKVNGKAEHLHEISRFVRENSPQGGRWFYIDGQPPATDGPSP